MTRIREILSDSSNDWTKRVDAVIYISSVKLFLLHFSLWQKNAFNIAVVLCRCTDKTLTDYWSADNRRLTIGRLLLDCQLIQKSYFAVLSYLFRL